MNIPSADLTLTEENVTQSSIPLPGDFCREAKGITTLVYAHKNNEQLSVEWNEHGVVCQPLFAQDYEGALKVGAKIRVTVNESPSGPELHLSWFGNANGAAAKTPGSQRKSRAYSAGGPDDNEIPTDALEDMDKVLNHFITSIEGDHQGWGAKLKSYRYARMNEGVSSIQHLVHFSKCTAKPFAQLCQAESIDWKDPATQRKLEIDAESICIWGGVPQGRGYTDAWKVAKSAIKGTVEFDAPMSSGWTKVAAFATDGCENEQTIWDSRESVSVIGGINSALNMLEMRPNASLMKWLGGIRVVLSQAKERKNRIEQLKNGRWEVGSCDWRSHFRGSAIVRRITALLRENKIPFPAFPEDPPAELGKDWDMFTVGMVLFMDGE